MSAEMVTMTEEEYEEARAWSACAARRVTLDDVAASLSAAPPEQGRDEKVRELVGAAEAMLAREWTNPAGLGWIGWSV